MAIPLTSIEPLLPIIAQRPLGFFSDIDGTLSPIAPTPQQAYIPSAVDRLLGQLAAAGVTVGLISGRTLADARRMVGRDDVVYVGTHGFDFWVDGHQETVPGGQEYFRKARQVLRELSSLHHPGVWMQDKGPVVAIHYRLAADPDGAREAILAAVAASAAAQAFRLHEGKRIFELRPPIAVNKGTALQALVERFQLQGFLCLGDDTTDVDMFRAAHALKASGLGESCVAVESPDVMPEVMATADYSVKGVEGVEWLLRELLTALPG